MASSEDQKQVLLDAIGLTSQGRLYFMRRNIDLAWKGVEYLKHRPSTNYLSEISDDEASLCLFNCLGHVACSLDQCAVYLIKDLNLGDGVMTTGKNPKPAFKNPAGTDFRKLVDYASDVFKSHNDLLNAFNDVIKTSMVKIKDVEVSYFEIWNGLKHRSPVAVLVKFHPRESELKFAIGDFEFYDSLVDFIKASRQFCYLVR